MKVPNGNTADCGDENRLLRSRQTAHHPKFGGTCLNGARDVPARPVAGGVEVRTTGAKDHKSGPALVLGAST